jgi:TolB protein
MLKALLKNLLKGRQGDQRSQLTVLDRTGGNARVVHETRDWIEAPNWSPDGRSLIFNGAGKLFRVGVDGGGAPERIDTGAIDSITNDHLVSPDGQWLYFTAEGGCVYAVSIAGGQPRKVSTDHLPGRSMEYYVHGISPDGQTLSCVGVIPGRATGALCICTLPTAGGSGTQITHTREPVDGPEFAADGRSIYFNAEIDSAPGHAQLFRMGIDGSNIEQLTRDERVNWFPHPSPDGEQIVYLSYPPGTEGHPPNKDVELRLMPVPAGPPKTLVKLFGGQGTINSNPWAHDSQRLAYVAYPRS